MRLFQFKQNVEAQTGLDTFNNDPDNLPESDEELELHMQLNYMFFLVYHLQLYLQT